MTLGLAVLMAGRRHVGGDQYMIHGSVVETDSLKGGMMVGIGL